ncbi:MAG TPA: hypothetical protein VEQ15_07615 [Myxococcales bacterium]|jgi:hypothetical protein|nr:hypothetical protein [Myxococcales bacterium]
MLDRNSLEQLYSSPALRVSQMAGHKETYTVVIAEQMPAVPAVMLDELRLSLKEIGAACEAVPATSPFWTSVAQSNLILDVGPWRFLYAIDGVVKRITVKGCKALR